MNERADDQAPAEQALDPRFIQQQRVVGRLWTLGVVVVLLAGLFIVFDVADHLPQWVRVRLGVIWLLVITGFAWHAEHWPAKVYAHTRYRLDADCLQIRRGVYWRAITHVPRSRVQHTDVSQGPVERHYGLGTLIVYTAGTDHARVVVSGLAHGTAIQLRDELRVDRTDDVV